MTGKVKVIEQVVQRKEKDLSCVCSCNVSSLEELRTREVGNHVMCLCVLLRRNWQHRWKQIMLEDSLIVVKVEIVRMLFAVGVIFRIHSTLNVIQLVFCLNYSLRIGRVEKRNLLNKICPSFTSKEKGIGKCTWERETF